MTMQEYLARAGLAVPTWKQWLQEISGAFGDTGLLLPILVSLGNSGQVSVAASLIFGGIWNITAGFAFGLPMCVQPMKGSRLRVYAVEWRFTY